MRPTPALVLAALAAFSSARPHAQEAGAADAPAPPKGRPKMTGAPACQEGITAPKDPLTQFTPGKTAMPCDAYHAVPFGPAPEGCAKFEVVAGEFFLRGVV